MCFLAEIYVYCSTFGVCGPCVRALLDGFVRQGEFHSRDSLTEVDKAEASFSGGQEHRLSAPIQEPA